MKQKLQKLLIAIAGLLVSANAFAHQFEVGGIYYNISSTSDLTCAVTYRGNYYDSYWNEYSGDVIIPETVTNNGTTYSVTSIDTDAFYRCEGLTSVAIGNSVTSIGESAFLGCFGLTSVTIPNSVTSIGTDAFYGCHSLTSVTIPNSVTSIGTDAFCGCNGLTSIIVESDNSMYDSRDNCNAIVETSTNTLIAGCENSTIPNSVTTIGDYAFYICEGLTSVTIPNSVTSIGYYAFCGCDGLTSVAIPNSVTSIGTDAFYGCEGLTSVTIGNSVTSIGEGAFYVCRNIRTIYSQSTTPPTYNNVFDDDVLMYSTLYVPTGCKSAYEAVDPWRNFWNIEEMDFNGIEDVVADGDEINVVANNGEIVVNGIENAMVEVYNINGQLVYSGNSTAIAVANKGHYIVTVSGKTFKIAL